MSQTDAEENILSETIAGQGDSDNLKLVPVAESIRYRKRAQSAEKRNEALAERLKEAESEATKISEQLNNIRAEQELMRKLAVAGAIDLETAVSVAKARMGGEAQMELDGGIEQLKKEKQYLFGNNTGGAVTAKKTAGAKDRIQNNQTILERAAKKAAITGSRTDLQEYLKLRRNFV
jgi:hypothetical protein